MPDDRRPRRAGAVSFRAEAPADGEVIRRAHVAHRAQLLAPIGWPADALARLCDQQHDLQEAHIAAQHPGADRRVILASGRAVGRLCLDATAVPWRIVDVAIVPEAQRRGIGTAALRRVFAEAAAAGASVELQVALDNPRAEALYRREGFVEAIGAAATHRRLVRPAVPRAAAAGIS